MAAALDAIEAQLKALPPDKLRALDAELMALTGDHSWVPNPGPQTDAFFSMADVLLYGGEPGGGKTDLALGLAFTRHKRALVMRRQYTDLSKIIDRMIELNGGKQGFNGSPPPSLKNKGVSIELGAAKDVGDEMHFMGNDHDLLAIDEATQFAEIQVRLLMGWVRTSDPKQRTRVVLATNPPLTSEGFWITKMFAPWLDKNFPNPALPGELRWVVTEGEDGDRWVDGPGKYTLNDGRVVEATSRTFIPSSVKDNPHYARSGYQRQLDALPEQIRAVLMGGFQASFKDAPNQIIPTDWIRRAQARWTRNPPVGVAMSAIGVDPSGGGTDAMALAMRHDGWFDELVEVPAKLIPKDKAGSFTAATVITHRRHGAKVILDMGGGYGSGCFEILRENAVDVKPYKGAESTSRKTKDGQLPFYNVRSEALWRFREALDPDQPGGSSIALPDDPALVADLTAPRLDLKFMDGKGIKAESKEDIVKRLGRSTNKGDAVIMAWFDGPKNVTPMGGGYEDGRRVRFVPKVIMGRRR